MLFLVCFQFLTVSDSVFNNSCTALVQFVKGYFSLGDFLVSQQTTDACTALEHKFIMVFVCAGCEGGEEKKRERLGSKRKIMYTIGERNELVLKGFFFKYLSKFCNCMNVLSFEINLWS